MTEDNYDPKYRAFRWVVDLPGLMPWIVSRAEMSRSDQLAVDFLYVNDMEIGTCPIDPTVRHLGRLKFLDPEGQIVRQGDFGFMLEEYIPFMDLNYSSSDWVRGRVILSIDKIAWK